jgi:hypothetical protein
MPENQTSRDMMRFFQKSHLQDNHDTLKPQTGETLKCHLTTRILPNAPSAHAQAFQKLL